MCERCVLVKYGKDRKGNQRYICKLCNKTQVDNPQSNRISKEIREIVERLHKEKLSYRAIARSVNISLNSVVRILEKKQNR